MRVAFAPARRGTFVADKAGEVRAVIGAGIDNVSKLYLRSGSGDEWKLLNDEATSQRIEFPLGFSDDGRTLFLQAEHPTGPDRIGSSVTTLPPRSARRAWREWLDPAAMAESRPITRVSRHGLRLTAT